MTTICWRKPPHESGTSRTTASKTSKAPTKSSRRLWHSGLLISRGYAARHPTVLGHPIFGRVCTRTRDLLSRQAARPPLPLLRSDQRKKLVPRLFVFTERAEHRARYGSRVLLFHAAHHHAEVLRFRHNTDAHRIQQFLNTLRDLLRHALLNLQTACKGVDDPRQLA